MADSSGRDPFAPRTKAAKLAQQGLEELYPDRNFKVPSSVHGLDYLQTEETCGTRGIRRFYLSGRGLNSYPIPIYCGHCCRCLFEKRLEVLWQLAQIVRDLPDSIECIHGQLFDLSSFSVREEVQSHSGGYYRFQLTAGHPVGKLRERQVERLKYLRKKGEDLGACSIATGTMHSLAIATPGSAEAAAMKHRAEQRLRFLSQFGLSDSCFLEPDLGAGRCDGELIRCDGRWFSDPFEPLLLILSETPAKASNFGPEPLLTFVIANPDNLIPYIGTLLDASRELVHNEGSGKAVRVSWCGRWRLTEPKGQEEADLGDLGSVKLDNVSLGAWPWSELSKKLEESHFRAQLNQLVGSAWQTLGEAVDQNLLRRYVRLWEVYFGWKTAAAMHRDKASSLVEELPVSTRAHHKDQAETIEAGATELLWDKVCGAEEVLRAQGLDVGHWFETLLDSMKGTRAA